MAGNVRIHPDLTSCIGPLAPEEKELLEKSILGEGVRDPLVVWEEECLLVDGHNRMEICDRHNIPFSIVYRSFRNFEEARGWIMLNQLGRRNLRKEQRDRIIRSLAENGIKQKDIAHKVGLSKQTISDIVHKSENRTEKPINSPVKSENRTEKPINFPATSTPVEEISRLQKELAKAKDYAERAEMAYDELEKDKEILEDQLREREEEDWNRPTFAEMAEISARVRTLETMLDESEEKLRKASKTALAEPAPEVREVEKVVIQEVAVPDPALERQLAETTAAKQALERELETLRHTGAGSQEKSRPEQILSEIVSIIGRAEGLRKDFLELCNIGVAKEGHVKTALEDWEDMSVMLFEDIRNLENLWLTKTQEREERA